MISSSFRMLTALSLVSALAGAVVCAGCSNQTAPGNTDPATGSPAAPAQTQAGGEPRQALHGGPRAMLETSLKTLTLTPAQTTTVEGALAALPHGHEGNAKPALPFADLAAQVRAGKIDAPAILAKVTEPTDNASAHRDAAAASLTTLYTTLTKEQRRALVDDLEKRMDAHKGGPKPREGRGVLGRGPLGHLFRDIDLTDAQRTSIDAALNAAHPTNDYDAMKARFEATHTEMRTRLEAFAGDTFDAKAAVAPMTNAPAEGMKAHVERMTTDLGIIVPLLTQAQRETLAAHLEKAPTHPAPDEETGE